MGGQRPEHKTATVAVVDRRGAPRGRNLPDKAEARTEDAAWLRTVKARVCSPASSRRQLGRHQNGRGNVCEDMIPHVGDAMINKFNRWPPSSSGSEYAKLLSFPVNTNKRSPVTDPHEAASSPRHTPTLTI